MLPKTILLPGKYVQGPDSLRSLGTELKRFGTRPILIWDDCVRKLFGETVLAGLASVGLQWTELRFRGQTLRTEASSLASRVQAGSGRDIVVGIGGGKTLDMAKAVAAMSDRPFATIPTVASNDSPTSSFTVWYLEDGRGDGFDSWGRCPDLVLVDTGAIVQAPVRMFLAGIGDAMATWYEAKAVADCGAMNCLGTPSTVAALSLAKSARDILFQYGRQAVQAVREHQANDAVEKVVEATILYSGIGFESGGLATAHQMANNMGILEETHGLLHGEEVSFGLATQLEMDETMDPEEREQVLAFLKELGLPVSLSDVGLGNASRDHLMALARLCDVPNSFARNHPFPVNADCIVNAMLKTASH